MIRERFKSFLKESLSGDGYTSQDIYIEDDKLNEIADKFIIMLDLQTSPKESGVEKFLVRKIESIYSLSPSPTQKVSLEIYREILFQINKCEEKTQH